MEQQHINRETLARVLMNKHLKCDLSIDTQDRIIKAMLEFSDQLEAKMKKGIAEQGKIKSTNITRERLIDLAGQLERIVQELMEASEAPASNPTKRDLARERRVAKHLNNIQKRYNKAR